MHCVNPWMVFIETSAVKSSETEVIWLGTKASLKKMDNINLTLHAGNDVIAPPAFATSALS